MVHTCSTTTITTCSILYCLHCLSLCFSLSYTLASLHLSSLLWALSKKMSFRRPPRKDDQRWRCTRIPASKSSLLGTCWTSIRNRVRNLFLHYSTARYRPEGYKLVNGFLSCSCIFFYCIFIFVLTGSHFCDSRGERWPNKFRPNRDARFSAVSEKTNWVIERSLNRSTEQRTTTMYFFLSCHKL